MSHNVIVEFNCAEGKGGEFLGALIPALVETRAYEGCESVETYADNANPDRIILCEKWAQRSNQEAYLNWRVETGMLDMIGPFMAAPPTFTHLDAKE